MTLIRRTCPVCALPWHSTPEVTDTRCPHCHGRPEVARNLPRLNATPSQENPDA